MASQLRVDKILPVDGAPTGGGGGIVQVNQFTLTNTANGGFLLESSSSSFTATPLLLAITTKFSTSKILINVSSSSYNGGSGHTTYTIYRDSTNIGGSTYGIADFTGSHNWTPFSMMFLDSPSTTSSVTYRVYGKTTNNTLYFGGDGDMVNAITLMEVSA